MTTETNLDIILPCYNPFTGWDQEVINSYKLVSESLKDITIGVILVNDGSSSGINQQQIDKLKAEIEKFTYLSYPENMGKGFALRKGVKRSQAKFQIYTDIDFPYEEKHIAEIYELLNSNSCALAVPVRDSTYYSNVPKIRTVISKILKGIIRIFLKLPTADTQAGLKGFNQSGKNIFLNTTINRYLFDLEFIYLASKSDRKIMTLPVTLKEGIVFSSMNWKVLLNEARNFARIILK